jgi:hypothetical protein
MNSLNRDTTQYQKETTPLPACSLHALESIHSFVDKNQSTHTSFSTKRSKHKDKKIMSRPLSLRRFNTSSLSFTSPASSASLSTSPASNSFAIEFKVVQIRGVNCNEVLIQPSGSTLRFSPSNNATIHLTAEHGITQGPSKCICFSQSIGDSASQSSPVDFKVRVSGLKKSKQVKLAKVHLDLNALQRQIEQETGQ